MMMPSNIISIARILRVQPQNFLLFLLAKWSLNKRQFPFFLSFQFHGVANVIRGSSCLLVKKAAAASAIDRTTLLYCIIFIIDFRRFYPRTKGNEEILIISSYVTTDNPMRCDATTPSSGLARLPNCHHHHDDWMRNVADAKNYIRCFFFFIIHFVCSRFLLQLKKIDVLVFV